MTLAQISNFTKADAGGWFLKEFTEHGRNLPPVRFCRNINKHQKRMEKMARFRRNESKGKIGKEPKLVNRRRFAIARDMEKDIQESLRREIPPKENGRNFVKENARKKQESIYVKVWAKGMRVMRTLQIRVNLIKIDQSSSQAGALLDSSILMTINLVVHLSGASIWSILNSIVSFRGSSTGISKLIKSFVSHPWKINISVNKTSFSLVRSSKLQSSSLVK